MYAPHAQDGSRSAGRALTLNHYQPVARLRTRVLPARLPHTIQLCIHCRENPAGFWVSRTGGNTVRRPWCLSCCQGLDPERCDMIPFDS
jgi:hypothetical protein